ncbi:addiction module protein [Luteolibacter flavescens]|uniref:Addiction module protein n=1 Tax=Luteolibacter flavescens TaxID=1859460 RepID=A0ABT3FP05_9BACT|nr:addiction module protein [Luteolibacter flavescens]MCW1885202.1 addiction module protein [Luteolibacter flavescens]
MSLAEIEKQVAALPVEERAALASFLLHSLPEPDHHVSDEEVSERVRQVKEGEAELISFEELRRGVFSDRAR